MSFISPNDSKTTFYAISYYLLAVEILHPLIVSSAKHLLLDAEVLDLFQPTTTP